MAPFRQGRGSGERELVEGLTDDGFGDLLQAAQAYIAQGVAEGNQEGLGTGLAQKIRAKWPACRRHSNGMLDQVASVVETFGFVHLEKAVPGWSTWPLNQICTSELEMV